MKVIYHTEYTEVYAYDPAAEPGRMEAICRALEGTYEFEEPPPATDADLRLCQTKGQIQNVEDRTPGNGFVWSLWRNSFLRCR